MCDYSRGRGITQVIHHIHHSPPNHPKFGIFFARPSFLLSNLRQRIIHGLWNSYESNQPTRLLIQLLGGLIILLPTYSSVYSSTLQPSFKKNQTSTHTIVFFSVKSIREPNKLVYPMDFPYGENFSLHRNRAVLQLAHAQLSQQREAEHLPTVNRPLVTRRELGTWWKRCPPVSPGLNLQIDKNN